MKHKLYKLALCLVVGTLIILVSTPIATKAIPYEDKVQQQYEKAITTWLIKLSMCESGGKADIEIMDINSKMSRGILMFQDDTWKSYAAPLFPNAEREELMNFVYDKDAQFRVAARMIRTDWNNHRHWTVCTGKIGKPPVYN